MIFSHGLMTNVNHLKKNTFDLLDTKGVITEIKSIGRFELHYVSNYIEDIIETFIEIQFHKKK